MEELVALLIPIVAILSCVALPIVLATYAILKNLSSKHKERMELIKQGIVPPESEQSSIPNRYRALRNGILCIGIAIGLLLGLLVSYTMNLNEEDAFWVVASGILLFLGLAYVVFYMMTNKVKDTDNNTEI